MFRPYKWNRKKIELSIQIQTFGNNNSLKMFSFHKLL